MRIGRATGPLVARLCVVFAYGFVRWTVRPAFDGPSFHFRTYYAAGAAVRLGIDPYAHGDLVRAVGAGRVSGRRVASSPEGPAVSAPVLTPVLAGPPTQRRASASVCATTSPGQTRMASPSALRHREIAATA